MGWALKNFAAFSNLSRFLDDSKCLTSPEDIFNRFPDSFIMIILDARIASISFRRVFVFIVYAIPTRIIFLLSPTWDAKLT
jgi:hypothetical protein